MPIALRTALVTAFLVLGALRPAAADDTPKSIVFAFYQLCFVQGKVAEAFARYVGPTYTQHNPRVPDGADAAMAFLNRSFTENPTRTSDIKRVIADGDLVAVHVNARLNAADRGLAIIGIFRVANGRIVEHWDIIQPVPETSANTNGMF